MARKKGSKNQKTLDWEAFGRELIDGGLPRLQKILMTCDDDDFVRIYIPMLEYFKPKLKRIENSQGEGDQKTIIEVKWDDKPPIYSRKIRE
jgi:hypothetical protein